MVVALEQADLSRAALVQRVESGENIKLTRNNEAVAQIVPQSDNSTHSFNGARTVSQTLTRSLLASFADDFDENPKDPEGRELTDLIWTPAKAKEFQEWRRSGPIVLGNSAGRRWIAEDFDAIPEGFEEYIKYIILQ